MLRLQFTDGTDTFDFAVNGITVLDYNPGVKPRTAKTVDDSIEILIESNSVEDQQAAKDGLNYWLALAAELRHTVNEQQIWLRFKRHSESEWRQSPVLGGQLKSLSINHHSQLKESYEIQLSRMNFWEWDEADLPLSAFAAGPFATTEINITNQFTPLFVDPTIAGDAQVPIPVRITVVPNNDPTPIGIDSFYLFHNAYGQFDARNKVHLLEGEDSIEGGTDEVDTESRFDTYRLVTWTPSANEQIFAWDLSAALVATFGGQWYRVLARLVDVPAEDLFLRLQLNYPSGVGSPQSPQSEVWINPVTDAGFRIVDLGAIQLPPVGVTPKPPAIQIAINGRSASADSIGIDFIALCPTDSFLQAKAVSLYNSDPMDAIIFDGYIGRTYLELDDEQFLDFQESGKHPGLVAGASNQFFTLVHDNRTSGSDINEIFGVTATYKPRRLTV